MTGITRRNFIKTSTAAFAGINIITNAGKVFGANNRVRVALVGLHGQGRTHLENYSKIQDVEIAALCDVDENVLAQRLAEMEKNNLKKPETYTDLRKLLEDKTIDAVSIATPNHWHSLQAIWACQAGKDVYVEKPLSHRWFEGHQLVKAAAKYNRIVQHGTNSRGSAAVREAVQKLNDGTFGEVYMSRGLCYKRRNTIGKAKEESVPKGVNYELWTGPAPLKPYTKNRFHYNWHWCWDTGDGDFGNQGIHELDVARWGLGVKFPNRISAIGGHVMFDDDQETPNILNVAYQFDMPDGKRRILEFEVRHWLTNSEVGIGTRQFGAGEIPEALGNTNTGKPASAGNAIGNVFYGSKGYLAIDGYTTYKSWLGDKLTPGPGRSQGGNTWANFIECVRSRKKEDLNAPVEEGHISCTLLHLGNISYRLGRTLSFDPEKETVTGDEEAARMLRGTYREPYVVPEEV